MAPFSVNTNNGPYGPIQQEFALDINDGYTVFTGPNDAGKSALLQLVMVRAFHDQSMGPDGVAFIPAHRGYVAPSTETRGARLATYNAELIASINNQPLQYGNVQRPDIADLPILLLNHSNFRQQTIELDQLLVALGFSELVLRDAQNVYFDDIAVVMHGAGLRSLFTIMCALTDRRLKLILIDEPENSLEPKLQKALRDILVARAASVKIAVATQSHLSLNRGEHDVALNHVVEKINGQVVVTPLKSATELWPITFNLLGNSTEDLFFPGNYMVVEGSSDQSLVEAILRLRAVEVTKVKVLSASGISNVRSRVSAILNALVPLILSDSPYANKVIVMIDRPNDSEKVLVSELEDQLHERMHLLPAPSLEEYLPRELYSKAHREKEQDLAELAGHQATGRLSELRRLKKEISEGIAEALEMDDLAAIPEMVSAVDMAIALAT